MENKMSWWNNWKKKRLIACEGLPDAETAFENVGDYLRAKYWGGL
jgi:hypothetical protein